jgi:hypothetical protein
LKKPPCLCTRTANQGAYDAVASHGQDAPESTQTRTSKKPQQNRLSLIVHRVAGCDLRTSDRSSDFVQKSVTHQTSLRLEVTFAESTWAQFSDTNRQAKLRGQRNHKLAILAAGRPQTVVYVGDRKLKR